MFLGTSALPAAHSLRERQLSAGLATGWTIGSRRIAIPGQTRMWEVDIALSHERLVIEYDGSHWHGRKLAHDRRKRAILESAGWTMLRIRETPLVATDATRDLIVPRALPMLSLIRAVSAHAAAIGGVPDPLPSVADETLLSALREVPLSPYQWRPFEEARAFVHTLGLRTVREWQEFARGPLRPPDIPIRPDSTYRHVGWEGLRHWLGPQPTMCVAT